MLGLLFNVKAAHDATISKNERVRLEKDFIIKSNE